MLAIFLATQSEDPHIRIALTFHCPGDRWPTVDISNAFKKIWVFPLPRSWAALVPVSAILNRVLSALSFRCQLTSTLVHGQQRVICFFEDSSPISQTPRGKSHRGVVPHYQNRLLFTK